MKTPFCKRRTRLWLAIAGCMILTAPAYAHEEDEDNCEGPKALALVNGKIHTMAKNDTVVSSALIGDGKFLAVGNENYAAEPCTEVIDLGGRTVVPGLTDNHNHIILLGLRPGNDVRLDKANSIQDALDLLVAKAEDVKKNEWVVSLGGFNINQFVPPPDAPRFPNLAELDAALSNNPVLLFQGFFGQSQTNRRARNSSRIRALRLA